MDQNMQCTFSFVVLLLSLTIHVTCGNTITPGQNHTFSCAPNEDCIVDCTNSNEQCARSTIICPTGNYSCEVRCHAYAACLEFKLFANDTYGQVNVSCTGQRSCRSSYMNNRNGYRFILDATNNVGAAYSDIFLPTYASQGYGGIQPFISLNFNAEYACFDCSIYGNGGVDGDFNKTLKYLNNHNLGTFELYCATRGPCYSLILNLTKNELINNVTITTHTNYDASDEFPEQSPFATSTVSVDYISNVFLDCRSYKGCDRLIVDSAIDANVTALCAAPDQNGTLTAFCVGSRWNLQESNYFYAEIGDGIEKNNEIVIYCPHVQGYDNQCRLVGMVNDSKCCHNTTIYAINGKKDIDLTCDSSLNTNDCWNDATIYCSESQLGPFSLIYDTIDDEYNTNGVSPECDNITPEPTYNPSLIPTNSPTTIPTTTPTSNPTISPTDKPTDEPTNEPSVTPSVIPTTSPTDRPTTSPTGNPTQIPTTDPTRIPTSDPTATPTRIPTTIPTLYPTITPTTAMPTFTRYPTDEPTSPTIIPSSFPSGEPTNRPSQIPSQIPSNLPSIVPTYNSGAGVPTDEPIKQPTMIPSTVTTSPSNEPTSNPTWSPSRSPTASPTIAPTRAPTIYSKYKKYCRFHLKMYNVSSQHKLRHEMLGYIANNETYKMSRMKRHLEYVYIAQFGDLLQYYEFDVAFDKLWVNRTVKFANGTRYSRAQIDFYDGFVHYIDTLTVSDSLNIEAESNRRRGTRRLQHSQHSSQYLQRRLLQTHADNDSPTTTEASLYIDYSVEIVVFVYALNTSIDSVQLITEKQLSTRFENVMKEEYNETDLYVQISDVTVGDVAIEDEIDNGKNGDPEQFSFTVILVTIVVIIGFITFMAWLHANQKLTCFDGSMGCHTVDEVKWWRLFIFAFQVFDLYSDVTFTTEIVYWLYVSQNYTKVSEMPTVDSILVFTTPIFVVIPYLANLLMAIRIKKKIPMNPHATRWFTHNGYFFSVLVILSGGVYASMLLVSSRLFGMYLFHSGLTRMELIRLQKVRVLYTVVMENLPQLIFQILFVIFHSELLNLNNTTFIMAFISSVTSILISVLSYGMQTQWKAATLNFQLIVQLHISTMQQDLLQIEKNKGMTFRLKENLSRALSINGDSIEVLQITPSTTGCQIDAVLIASDDSNKANIYDYTELNVLLRRTVVSGTLHKAVKRSFHLQKAPANVKYELPVVILDNGIQRQNSLFHLGHATHQQLQKGFGNSLANAAALLNNRTKDMLDGTPIVMPDLTNNNNSPGHSVSNKFPSQPWIKNGHLSVVSGVSGSGNHLGNNNHNHNHNHHIHISGSSGDSFLSSSSDLVNEEPAYLDLGAYNLENPITFRQNSNNDSKRSSNNSSNISKRGSNGKNGRKNRNYHNNNHIHGNGDKNVGKNVISLKNPSASKMVISSRSASHEPNHRNNTDNMHVYLGVCSEEASPNQTSGQSDVFSPSKNNSNSSKFKYHHFHPNHNNNNNNNKKNDDESSNDQSNKNTSENSGKHSHNDNLNNDNNHNRNNSNNNNNKHKVVYSMDGPKDVVGSAKFSSLTDRQTVLKSNSSASQASADMINSDAATIDINSFRYDSRRNSHTNTNTNTNTNSPNTNSPNTNSNTNTNNRPLTTYSPTFDRFNGSLTNSISAKQIRDRILNKQRERSTSKVGKGKFKNGKYIIDHLPFNKNKNKNTNNDNNNNNTNNDAQTEKFGFGYSDNDESFQQQQEEEKMDEFGSSNNNNNNNNSINNNNIDLIVPRILTQNDIRMDNERAAIEQLDKIKARYQSDSFGSNPNKVHHRWNSDVPTELLSSTHPVISGSDAATGHRHSSHTSRLLSRSHNNSQATTGTNLTNPRNNRSSHHSSNKSDEKESIEMINPLWMANRPNGRKHTFDVAKERNGEIIEESEAPSSQYHFNPIHNDNIAAKQIHHHHQSQSIPFSPSDNNNNNNNNNNHEVISPPAVAVASPRVRLSSINESAATPTAPMAREFVYVDPGKENEQIKRRKESSAQEDTDVESMYDNTGLVFETKRAPPPPRKRHISPPPANPPPQKPANIAISAVQGSMSPISKAKINGFGGNESRELTNEDMDDIEDLFLKEQMAVALNQDLPRSPSKDNQIGILSNPFEPGSAQQPGSAPDLVSPSSYGNGGINKKFLASASPTFDRVKQMRMPPTGHDSHVNETVEDTTDNMTDSSENMINLNDNTSTSSEDDNNDSSSNSSSGYSDVNTSTSDESNAEMQRQLLEEGISTNDHSRNVSATGATSTPGNLTDTAEENEDEGYDSENGRMADYVEKKHRNRKKRHGKHRNDDNNINHHRHHHHRNNDKKRSRSRNNGSRKKKIKHSKNRSRDMYHSDDNDLFDHDHNQRQSNHATKNNRHKKKKNKNKHRKKKNDDNNNDKPQLKLNDSLSVSNIQVQRKSDKYQYKPNSEHKKGKHKTKGNRRVTKRRKKKTKGGGGGGRSTTRGNGGNYNSTGGGDNSNNERKRIDEKRIFAGYGDFIDSGNDRNGMNDNINDIVINNGESVFNRDSLSSTYLGQQLPQMRFRLNSNSIQQGRASHSKDSMILVNRHLDSNSSNPQSDNNISNNNNRLKFKPKLPKISSPVKLIKDRIKHKHQNSNGGGGGGASSPSSPYRHVPQRSNERSINDDWTLDMEQKEIEITGNCFESTDISVSNEQHGLHDEYNEENNKSNNKRNSNSKNSHGARKRSKSSQPKKNTKGGGYLTRNSDDMNQFYSNDAKSKTPGAFDDYDKKRSRSRVDNRDKPRRKSSNKSHKSHKKHKRKHSSKGRNRSINTDKESGNENAGRNGRHRKNYNSDALITGKNRYSINGNRNQNDSHGNSNSNSNTNSELNRKYTPEPPSTSYFASPSPSPYQQPLPQQMYRTPPPLSGGNSNDESRHSSRSSQRNNGSKNSKNNNRNKSADRARNSESVKSRKQPKKFKSRMKDKQNGGSIDNNMNSDDNGFGNGNGSQLKKAVTGKRVSMIKRATSGDIALDNYNQNPTSDDEIIPTNIVSQYTQNISNAINSNDEEKQYSDHNNNNNNKNNNNNSNNKINRNKGRSNLINVLSQNDAIIDETNNSNNNNNNNNYKHNPNSQSQSHLQRNDSDDVYAIDSPKMSDKSKRRKKPKPPAIRMPDNNSNSNDGTRSPPRREPGYAPHPPPRHNRNHLSTDLGNENGFLNGDESPSMF